MKTIDYSDAQNRLHDMWRAVLAGEEVLFVRNGAPIARIIDTVPPDERDALIDELKKTIGFEFIPRA